MAYFIGIFVLFASASSRFVTQAVICSLSSDPQLEPMSWRETVEPSVCWIERIKCFYSFTDIISRFCETHVQVIKKLSDKDIKRQEMIYGEVLRLSLVTKSSFLICYVSYKQSSSKRSEALSDTCLSFERLSANPFCFIFKNSFVFTSIHHCLP